MKAKTLRTLSVTGAVAALLIAASPAWAHYEGHGHHYGYARFVYPNRPAVVVPPVVTYAYPTARVYPMYYAPLPVYVPAPVYYRPRLRVRHWPGRHWAYRG
jgi:hypothetical protein